MRKNVLVIVLMAAFAVGCAASGDAASLEQEGDAQELYAEEGVSSSYVYDADHVTLVPSSSSVSSIYYTTDATAPVYGSSRLYTEPIDLGSLPENPNKASAVSPSLFDMNSGHTYYDIESGTVKNWLSPPKEDEVDKCTVIRAIGVDSDGNTVTSSAGTFFSGDIREHIEGVSEAAEGFGEPLMIVSIIGDHDDFFDYDRGIYVAGRVFDETVEKLGINKYDLEPLRKYDANYNQRDSSWERAVHVDFFESDGADMELVFSSDCGIRVQGNYSRSDLQKGLRLYARKDYGNKTFEYPFFPDALDDRGDVIASYKKLTLRAGGNCAFVAKYNDSFWEYLLHDTDMETMYSRPCVVYLNGEYWGVYVLQQDYGAELLQEKYGVRKESVVIYKGDAERYLRLGYGIDDGGIPDGEEQETAFYYNELLDFFHTHSDASDDESYEALCALVDPDSVRDYFAAEIWMNNKWDWPGKNWLMWRADKVFDISHPRAREMADGRWRFMLNDMDFGGWSDGEVNTNTIKEDNYTQYGLLDRNTNNLPVRVFYYLMTNKAFREGFYDRLRELDSTVFAPENAIPVLDRFHSGYYPLLHQFYVRYYGRENADEATEYALNTWGGGYGALKGYIEGRSAHIEPMISWAEETMMR